MKYQVAVAKINKSARILSSVWSDTLLRMLAPHSTSWGCFAFLERRWTSVMRISAERAAEFLPGVLGCFPWGLLPHSTVDTLWVRCNFPMLLDFLNDLSEGPKDLSVQTINAMLLSLRFYSTYARNITCLLTVVELSRNEWKSIHHFSTYATFRKFVV